MFRYLDVAPDPSSASSGGSAILAGPAWLYIAIGVAVAAVAALAIWLIVRAVKRNRTSGRL